MREETWSATILSRLALHPDVLLTLALDPDDLLLEEAVQIALQEAAVGLLTLNPNDPFRFRYRYESAYRSRWDAGERPRLLVRLAGTDPNLFPYDLLARAGGREAVRDLSLIRFFPLLAYPVLQELARHDRPALARLHVRYRGNPPVRCLGPQQTRRYLLREVYDVTPQTVRTPTDLIHYLLRRHRRSEHPPPSLDAMLLEWWREEPGLSALPLETFLRDEASLLRALRSLWPAYLARQGVPVEAEEPTSLPDPSLLSVYDDPEVQAYLDTLFLEGRLRPVRLREPAQVYGWMQVGVLFDEEDYRRERLHRLMTQLGSVLSGTEFDYRDWLAFAPRWAEALRLRWMADLSGEEAERFERLHGEVEERFAAWLRERYAALATVPPIPEPVMGHQVAETLAYRRRRGMGRMALVVVDGLAWDQWLVLRDGLELEPPEEHSLFAWVPTLTAIARQALFAGRPPYAFADTWDRTDVDGRRWRAFWAEQDLSSEAVAYLRDPSKAELKERVTDARVQVVGIVLTQVDRMAHGEQLGSAGLHRSIRQWAEDRRRGPAWLLDHLKEAGFACWLTSDHGNFEAVGIGAPREGALVEKGGQRARIYDDERLRERAHAQVPQALAWTPEGLPEGLCLLLAPGRTAFLPPGKRAICHGGVALEEVVVPFARLF